MKNKRGIGIWNWDPEGNGVKNAMNNGIFDWYYTWKPHEDGIDTFTNNDIEFIPMLWGINDVTLQNIELVQDKKSPYLLTFNEPDNLSQANMSVEEAIELWPMVQRTNKILGSPAVAYENSVLHNDGWLQRFMEEIKSREYHVDFLCIHRYTETWNTIEEALDDLRNYLLKIYEKYKKPIWLTEFSLIKWNSYTTGDFPSEEMQCQYARKVQEMLNELPFVERYAWFSASSYNSGEYENTFLFTQDGTLTNIGKAYCF